ncbi:hypothetical protein SCALM49S_08982 [Streptomyces californicus]
MGAGVGTALDSGAGAGVGTALDSGAGAGVGTALDSGVDVDVGVGSGMGSSWRCVRCAVTAVTFEESFFRAPGARVSSAA